MELKSESVPLLGSTFKLLDGEAIDYGKVIFILGLVVIISSLIYFGISETKVVSFLFYTAPLWLPYLTFHVFFEKWTEMVGLKYAHGMGRSVVEVILPPMVTKSPEAMEFVFSQIHNVASPDNLMQTYIDGKRPLPYTFEIVSRAGDVHFYATLPGRFVRTLKDNLYAQYPGIEVRDMALDYTAEVPNDLKGWTCMSFNMNKKKDDVLPIKTYVDFKLDMMPKEEEKVDPLTPMLEVISSIGPGQQVWIQFICIAHREKSFKLGQLEAHPEWTKEAADKINEIMNRDPKTRTAKEGGSVEEIARLTTGERKTIEAIERNMAKYAYETAIRWCYIVDESIAKFDPSIIPRVIRSFSATEQRNQNGIGVRSRTDFNYKLFSDPFGTKLPAWKKSELKYYKKRSVGEITKKVFSVEELATLWHPPGLVAITPTLNRVVSTRSEAPSNLPTGNF